jgi:hypothetical protein
MVGSSIVIFYFLSEYCADIKIIAILLIVVTVTVLLSLLFSCCVTIVTSVALCRAKSIAVSFYSHNIINVFTLTA